MSNFRKVDLILGNVSRSLFGSLQKRNVTHAHAPHPHPHPLHVKESSHKK